MKRREQLWDRPLSEREVRFLLGGFAALPTPHWRDLPEPEGTRIFEWFLGDAGPVFERHREFLHAEAKRLGIGRCIGTRPVITSTRNRCRREATAS